MRRQCSKTRDKGARRELQASERQLKKEIRTREERVVHEVVKGSDVVCTTNVGAAAKLIQRLFGEGQRRGTASADGVPGAPTQLHFDLVIIDEAAQAIEASCWIPLLLGKRAVFAGDHLQVCACVLLLRL